MSIIEDVLEAWRERHEMGVCGDGRPEDGECPFCYAKHHGISVYDLMEG